MIAYHIDRRNNRSVGEILKLDTDYFTDWKEYSSYIYSLFPDGLSEHGNTYLDPAIFQTNLPLSIDELCDLSSFSNSHLIEAFFELIRRNLFPTLPSRLQCFFGVEQLSDFKYWPELFEADNKVFQIQFEQEQSIKLDASFLTGGISVQANPEKLEAQFAFPHLFKSAISYWSGKTSNSPKFEILVKPPILIAKEVQLL